MDTSDTKTDSTIFDTFYHGLSKEERIYKKKVIDILFDKTSPSFAQFPLRVIYRILSQEEENLQSENVSVLFSVSKRHFKRAVKRNRVKRQLREAYRLHKAELATVAHQKEIKLSVAFLWLSGELWDTQKIMLKMQQILNRLTTELNHEIPVPIEDTPQ